MSEDSRLVRLMRRGERDALRRLYEKYSDCMFAVAVSVLRDRHSAEDCVHDVFVHFAGNSCICDIHGSAQSYLVKSVVNRARDILRKPKPHFSSDIIKEGSRIDCDGPAKQISDSEETSRVFEALAKIPSEQREVVVLRLQGEMKFREIAKLVGVSINTIKSRYSYGIEKLRTLL